MPEKAIPSIPIMLDKERHLKFTLGGIIRFQEITGKDLRNKEVQATLGKELTLKDLRAFMWAFLFHEDKELTLEVVGDLIDLNELPAITAKLYEAIGVAVPEKKGDSEVTPPLP